MFNKNTNHGNDVILAAQLVFPFLQHRIFQEISTEMGIKTVNGIVKNNQQQFSKVCTLIVHRNDVKTLKTLQ